VKLTPTPPIDPLPKVEAVTVAAASLSRTGELGSRGAAALAVPLISGAVDLSPLGRTVAALAAFGFPVVDVGPEAGEAQSQPAAPQEPLPEEQAAQAGASHGTARHIAQTLAGALSLRAADAAEGWLPPDTEPHASSEAAPEQAGRTESAARQAAPVQSPAGSLLNAMLSAALTGQTALEVIRRDHRPLRMELQREPDGHGGFRIARIRIRHQTEDGLIDVTAEMALGAAFQGDHAPMNVDVSSSGALAAEVCEQLGSLREALQARGLSSTVRAQAAD
jgi:hypothetical protein